MVCTNWSYFKYLKISQDLKKYIEEYALCICNTSYLYLVSMPIKPTAPSVANLQHHFISFCSESFCFKSDSFAHSTWRLGSTNQTWSREHKAQGQGHKKKSEAKDTLSEDRTSQGQGHRRKRSPKKKGLQNFFSGDLQFIGVPRIFDWVKPKPQITWNDVIKIFPKRKYLWDKAFVGWKIWNRCCLFACNQDFAKEEGLN